MPFRPSSAVSLTELTKLLLCAFCLLVGWQTWPQGTPPWRQAAPFALSALLYGANNNLVIYLQRYMDPSTYQVLSNLKIGSTALLYASALGILSLHVRGWHCCCCWLQEPAMHQVAFRNL